MKPWIAKRIFYPTFLWNWTLGRIFKVRRWWDKVDEHVWLGAMPLKRDAPKLKAFGIGGVINMCEEYPGPVAAYREVGIDQLWLPTVDFQPPSLEMVQQGVEFIEEHVQRNEGVYIHCKAGRARSATVVLCWLVKYRGMSPAEAQKHLILCRPHVHAKLPEREVVKQFCAALPEIKPAEQAIP